MPELHILRQHSLGLPKARKIAFEWAEKAEKDLSMECTYQEGKTSDDVEFSRSGVKGMLKVTAERFELNLTLGFLLGAFKGRIESEIVKNLDSLLAAGAGDKADDKSATKAAQPKSAAAKTATAKTPAAKKAAGKK